MPSINKVFSCQVSPLRALKEGVPPSQKKVELCGKQLPGFNKVISLISLFLLLGFSICAKEVTDDQKILYIDEQIRFADGLVSRGHYDLAIEEYVRLTKKFADDPLAAEAWVQLGEAYAAKKDFKSAIETFDTFFIKFPKVRIVPAASLKYALTLHKTKDTANVKKAFQILDLLKNDKKSPEVIQDAASFYLYKIYLAEKAVDKAVSELEILVKKDIKKSPEHDFRASAVIELAELFISLGKIQTAEKMLLPLTSKKGLSPSIMTKVQWSLGDLYYSNQEYEKSAETFAKFAILFPENSFVPDALYKRLQSLYMMKDYSKVISETDRIIKDGRIPAKGWERFYCIKAAALSSLKFYKGSIENLEKVLAATKDRKMLEFAAYKYVEALVMNKNLNMAVKTSEKYISQSDFSRKVTKDMAFFIADSSDSNVAEGILRKAIAGVRPDSENATFLKLKLGSILMISGQNEKALTLYSDLEKSGKKELKSYAIMGKGQALEKLGKKKEAANQYKVLMKNYPKSELYAEAMLRIAVVLLGEKKEWETSKLYFNELMSRFPKEPTSKLATFYLGYLSFYEKDYENSKKILSKLLNAQNITPGLKKDIEIYLIWSLMRLNETDSVILIFRSIKKPEPFLEKGSRGFLNELGNLLIKNNPESSMSCFKELLNRKDKRAVQLGYLGAAKVDMRNGDPVKAIEKLKKSADIEEDPKITSEALITLGKLLAERGKQDDAVLVFEKCIDNAVDKNTFPMVHFELAKILSKQPKRLKAANRYAMKAYIRSQDKKIRSEAMLLSIEISLKQNKRLEADKTWQDFKKNFPELLGAEKAKNIKKLLGE